LAARLARGIGLRSRPGLPVTSRGLPRRESRGPLVKHHHPVSPATWIDFHELCSTMTSVTPETMECPRDQIRIASCTLAAGVRPGHRLVEQQHLWAGSPAGPARFPAALRPGRPGAMRARRVPQAGSCRRASSTARAAGSRPGHDGEVRKEENRADHHVFFQHRHASRRSCGTWNERAMPKLARACLPARGLVMS